MRMTIHGRDIRSTFVVLLLVAAAVMLPGSGSSTTLAANSDGDGSVTGRVLDVSARIFGGRYNDRVGGRSDCSWTPISEFLPPVPVGDKEVPLAQSERTVNGILEMQYASLCGDPPQVSEFVWVPQVTPATILPDLLDIMRGELADPVVRFVNVDPEFGWAYVTAPLDFRVDGLAPLSVTARVSRGPLFVWATLTATPSLVRFDPGEPEGRPVSCSPVGARAAFVLERPGECAYTFVDSSAVSANGRTFSTVTSVEWTISYTSSSGSGSYPAVTTSTSTELGVAEVQALVTCTGSRPEQGGC